MKQTGPRQWLLVQASSGFFRTGNKQGPCNLREAPRPGVSLRGCYPNTPFVYFFGPAHELKAPYRRSHHIQPPRLLTLVPTISSARRCPRNSPSGCCTSSRSCGIPGGIRCAPWAQPAGYTAVAPDTNRYDGSNFPHVMQDQYTGAACRRQHRPLIKSLGEKHLFVVAHDRGLMIAGSMCLFRQDMVKRWPR